MKREEVEWFSSDYEVVPYEPGEWKAEFPLNISDDVIVKFRLERLGLGFHPSVPRGTVLLHPLSVSLFRGFVVEGDLLEVSLGGEVELISSPLAFPPILKKKKEYVVPKDTSHLKELLERKYEVIYAGGALLHGKSFVPPLLKPLSHFKEIVSLFKGEDTARLSHYGVPPEERYLHLVGPFFGYHEPSAVQMADEEDPLDLVRRWSGSTLLELPYVEMGLREHREEGMRSSGFHGQYPIRTPWRVMVCPENHASPLRRCPRCDRPTEPGFICPFCGNVYKEGGKCPRDGYDLLSSSVFDPSELFPLYEKRYGRVGEISVRDGVPEHPLKMYFRKKTNLELSEGGHIALDVVAFPGDQTLVPSKLVDPLLRIYRFVKLVASEVFGEELKVPERREELKGAKLLLFSGDKPFLITVDGIGSRFTVRHGLFSVLPSKRVHLAVLEDVILNGNIERVYVYEGEGEPIPVEFSGERSLFESELKPERLVELYNEVVELVGGDPSLAVPLLFPTLRKMEAALRKPLRYRCKGCGALYHRKPLNSCPRCGGEVVLEEGREVPDIDDLIERFSRNEHVVRYLKIFKKRLGRREVQRSILDLF
ncbi:MAG: hypothetical protein GXO00_02850 [Candidatus Diapherotrites archaeon]|nr:hypothetical protein [Candidatus Diapherotrites archaeon]